jgi:hypothetical protein
MSELLRVEFRIVMLDRDENGVICGERPIAEGTVSPARLDEFPDAVREHASKDEQ